MIADISFFPIFKDSLSCGFQLVNIEQGYREEQFQTI